MRYLRLDLLSLEDRRTLSDEIVLYKIYSKRINTTLTDQLHFNRPIRISRQNNNNIFYLPFVTTNMEYFAPLLRLQRQHDIMFSNIDLNEPCLSAMKRYALYETKNNQFIFDYSFE